MSYKNITAKAIRNVADNIEQSDGLEDESKSCARCTLSTTQSLGFIGNIIAAILSWETNHSIMWAAIQSFCGWFYVIYWYFFSQPPQ